MVTSGATATDLSNEIDKTRETCQRYLYYSYKAGYLYKKKINGVSTYFIKKDLAEKLIEHKTSEATDKIPQIKLSSILAKNKIPTINPIKNKKIGLVFEKVIGKGIVIKDVHINELGFLIEEFRQNIDPDFNFEITTNGDTSQIFLSEKQIFSWAYQSIGDFLENLDNNKYQIEVNNKLDEEVDL